MTTFILIAAALVIAAAGAIAVPLLRREGGSAQAPWSAFAVVVVLGVGAVSLYAALSNWSWSKAQAEESSPQGMVARLARRLQSNPQDMKGWLMLGQSYLVLGEAPLAERAYARADRLAGGRNVEALLGLAQALSVQDQNQLGGRAGQLIEQALALDPHSPKALFFGAAVALHRGALPLARERLQALLPLNPPPDVRPIIEQQIAAIDQRLAIGATPAGTPSVAAGTQSGGSTPDGGTAAPEETAVRIKVALSPKLGFAPPAGAPLFVFVRDPQHPGPPLLVKRLPLQLPQTVELTAADSMIAGRAPLKGQEVQVVARIARSGSPIAQPGDPFGEVHTRIGRDDVVDVIIDRLTP